MLAPALRARQRLPVAVGFSFFRKKSDAFFLKAEISSQQYTSRAGGATRWGRGCFLVCACAEGAAGSRLRARALRQGGQSAARPERSAGTSRKGLDHSPRNL